MMSNEEHHHLLEMENSQYQTKKSSSLIINLSPDKPSDIEKCKSKMSPRYLTRWPYLTEVLKGKYG